MSDSSNSDAKLLTVQEKLDKISRKMATEAKIMLTVGLIVLAVLTGYFVWGLNKIQNELLEPSALVALGNQMLTDQLPSLVESVEEQLTTAAPDWAKSLSAEAVTAVPTAREKLENQIMEQARNAIEQRIQIGDKEFSAVLQANRAVFEETLESLATDEEYSDETVQIFVDAINKEMGQDMQDQAEQVFGTLVALREKTEKLAAPGGSPTKEERIERDILSILRRLQLSEADLKKARADAAAAEEKAKQEREDKLKESTEGEEKPEGVEKPAEGEEKPEAE